MDSQPNEKFLFNFNEPLNDLHKCRVGVAEEKKAHRSGKKERTQPKFLIYFK